MNAQDAMRTQLCAALNCPDDAEPGELLCARCDRRLSRPPPPPPAPPEPRLWCSACCRFKPDRHFFHDCRQNGRARRGRGYECRDCHRRRQARTRRDRQPS